MRVYRVTMTYEIPFEDDKPRSNEEVMEELNKYLRLEASHVPHFTVAIQEK